MQKIIASIIIAAGLIISASIIADKDKGIGRYMLFQERSFETVEFEDGSGNWL